MLLKPILVVEDDPYNAMLMEKVLKKIGGFDSIIEEDVDRILKLVRDDVVCMVILDVSLSRSRYQEKNLDGVEIAKLIRSIPEKGSIPILLLTAFAMPDDDKRLLESSGADYYVPKPVRDIVNLVEIIKKLISGDVSELPEP